MANTANLREIEASALFESASPEELMEAAARKIAARRVEEAQAHLPELEAAADAAARELTAAEEALAEAKRRLAEARVAYHNADRALQATKVSVEDLVPGILATMSGEAAPKSARPAGTAKAVAKAKVLWACEDHPVVPQDLSHFAFVHLHKYGGELLKSQYGEPDDHVLEITDPAGRVHHVRAYRAD